MTRQASNSSKEMAIGNSSALLDALVDIFPDYRFERDEYDIAPVNFHAVMADFIYFFGKNNESLNEKQLRDFGSLINRIIELGGELENAFATCFLEHLRQLRIDKPLSSYLSREAKSRLWA